MAASITPGITVKNAGSERALSQEEQPPGIQSWQVFWGFFLFCFVLVQATFAWKQDSCLVPKQLVFITPK